LRGYGLFQYNKEVRYRLVSTSVVKHGAMKTYGGSGRYIDGGEWLASRPGRFTSVERTSGISWMGGWLGSTASLDAVKQIKVFLPC
jgi:hypothetical protein